MNKLTTSMLARITNLVNSQNPYWGILVANEYLEPNAPLRLALIKKARARASSSIEVGEAIYQGATLADLSSEAQETVRAYRLSPRAARERRVVPPMYRNCVSARRDVAASVRRQFTPVALLRTNIRQLKVAV